MTSALTAATATSAMATLHTTQAATGSGSHKTQAEGWNIGDMASKLGKVIRALSWTKAHAYALGVMDDPSTMILNDQDVHVHMLEGSIGKEGPSMGTALLSAFISLFTKTLISLDIAVTGEILLIRQVLPVSRLKEKILAVHCTGIKTILVPELNTL
jgi:ATP-dependent Lon protease